MVDRLQEDHAMAQRLGEGLRGINGVRLLHPVQTNIIRIDVSGLKLNAEQFVTEISKYDILTEAKGYNIIRFVTHRDINNEKVIYTIKCIKEIAER